MYHGILMAYFSIEYFLSQQGNFKLVPQHIVEVFECVSPESKGSELWAPVLFTACNGVMLSVQVYLPNQGPLLEP